MWRICGNTEIILYSGYSNPAFCDLTSTQIFWFYREFILCDLIVVLNGGTLALGSTYGSRFGYRNKNIWALNLGMVLGDGVGFSRPVPLVCSSRDKRRGREML